jgi:hypothetical protein
MSKLAVRSSGIVAVVCGSLLANLVPGLLGNGGMVRAMWCWEVGDYTANGYYAETETCCGGYTCYQTGQCSGATATPSADDALSSMDPRPGTDCAATTATPSADTVTEEASDGDVAGFAFDSKKATVSVLVLVGQCLL